VRMRRMPWAGVRAGILMGLFNLVALTTYDCAAQPPPPSAAAPNPSDAAQLRIVIEKLAPLHTKMGKVQPGDWLESHKEAGQTFDEYLVCKPTLPTLKRGVIYIQPIGQFSPTQKKIITLTADFMGRYFNLPVKVKEDLPESVVPAEARSKHPVWEMEQIRTTYILDKVLLPRLPDDAAAYIGFTTTDLWPGPGWNFVFGQAYLDKRVGVWSIYRNGDPDAGNDAFPLCLLRTLKLATHETGHMFSMQHCIAYECNMCGCNNREESDRRSIALCPECVAKLCWATQADPVERFRTLSAFFKEQGFKPEREFCDKCIRVLTRP
jgi:archaemetzincin